MRVPRALFVGVHPSGGRLIRGIVVVVVVVSHRSPSIVVPLPDSFIPFLQLLRGISQRTKAPEQKKKKLRNAKKLPLELLPPTLITV